MPEEGSPAKHAGRVIEERGDLGQVLNGWGVARVERQRASKGCDCTRECLGYAGQGAKVKEAVGELVPRVRAIRSQLHQALRGFHYVARPGRCGVPGAQGDGEAGQVSGRQAIAVAPGSLHWCVASSTRLPLAGSRRAHAREREGGIDLESVEELLGRFTEPASPQQRLSVQVGAQRRQ